MGIYSKKIRLRYSDIGSSNRLNLKSLIGYLQEMAGAHSSLAGYGYRYGCRSGVPRRSCV